MHFFILPLKVVFMYCGESKEGISTSFFFPPLLFTMSFVEWKSTHVPLGKGFSFYMCHVYQGKVLIK